MLATLQISNSLRQKWTRKSGNDMGPNNVANRVTREQISAVFAQELGYTGRFLN